MLVERRNTAMESLVKTVTWTPFPPLWAHIGAVAYPIFATRALNNALHTYKLRGKNPPQNNQEINRKIHYHKEIVIDSLKAMLFAGSLVIIGSASLLLMINVYQNRKKT